MTGRISATLAVARRVGRSGLLGLRRLVTRRWLWWTAASVGLLMLAAGGVVVAYVASVPVPKEPTVVQASVLYYRDGKTILARIGISDRTDVTLEQIPLAVRRAVLAAEDRSYYDHVGVSPRGVLRAVWANLFSGASEGASTITQQYARNAYLTQDVTAERKAKEFALALKLERRYTKDEILQRYLNTIYFGRGAYGIQAAAAAYFGISVEQLTLTQGAVLASLIKDPWAFDPVVDPVGAQDRWRWLVGSMETLGWADPGTADGAYPTVTDRSPNREALSGPLGLVVDAVENELVAKGISRQVLYAGGLRVVTTLDVTAQRAALDRVEKALIEQPFGLQAALVAQDPGTGGVRAYYGGDRGSGYFDYAQAPRPVGATFKPVTVAAALHAGIPYDTRWNGSSPRIFKDRFGVPLYNPNNFQCPDCTLEFALTQSLNTPFYAAAQKVGPDKVRKLATSLGVPDKYGNQRTLVDAKNEPAAGRTRADIALGRYPVAPVDLAGVYATLASGGTYSERHFVDSVEDGEGRRYYSAAPRRSRAVSQQVAAEVGQAMATALDSRLPAGELPIPLPPVGKAPQRPTLTEPGANRPEPDRPAAGISGSQILGDGPDTQDAWMAGYTAQLATVVWVGHTNPGPVRDMAGKPITGDGLPLTLWRDFLTDALAGQPASPLPSAANSGGHRVTR
ncbi:membrane peptidoglycan carboxypeptidase [Micromonospora pisi]|uniref:Membrane peptidoglycan carboxypeptidase n=1 Tax=Micromonospora pisi TaxID=589240 RepID=A0A495JRH5_9ACTN|nr:transglycosylase domain-containing protein [Micromonospora pisi]RKR91118.1 membrane peptidoglycan carboxypeptidase [Micromonospora pisi]